MSYTCQSCARRKVKCDKTAPTCSSCRRGKLECVYQVPRPRTRKRRLSDDLVIAKKLARYERVLRQHGLLDEAIVPPSGSAESTSEEKEDPITLQWGHEPLVSGSGKLLAGEGKSRYINGSFWRDLEDEDMQRVSDVEEDGDDDGADHHHHRHYSDGQSNKSPVTASEMLTPDPLTGALMGFRRCLLRYHPKHQDAMFLWKVYAGNVEPLRKILHIPSTGTMVQRVSWQPTTASTAEECQLFTVYHFAIYSMTDDECIKSFSQSRTTLLEKYNFAARQALVNASFLRTTEMSVLQALVLYLMPCQFYYDSQTFWTLTGVAVRIAQRIGLHRDGQKLGLPPFEVEMRRRLFYQLVPLEGISSQLAGTSITMPPDTWDVQPALNVNDDEIWPGMTETPKEHNGATEMIFCLARLCVGKYLAQGGSSASGHTSQFKDCAEAERFIDEAEKEVETKYIRYCDVIDPLHFLAMALARAGIMAMRIRVRLQRIEIEDNTAMVEERRGLFQLCLRLLDTDGAVHSNQGLIKFRWHIRPLSLWGTWGSLIFVLTTMLKNHDGLLSVEGINAAWDRIETIYRNHEEVLESRRALYRAFGRLTLKAWNARPRGGGTGVSEPPFIDSLRSRQKPRRRIGAERRKDSLPADLHASSADADTHMDPASVFGGDPLSGTSLSDSLGFEFCEEFDVDTTDWCFWEQLIRNHQV